VSNEAKGPYKVEAFGDGFIVVSPTGKAVYSSHYIGDCDRHCQYFNQAVSNAITSQAARVKELEEALRLVREEARAWREEWRLYNMRGGGFMRPFIYEMNTDANDCLNTPALTPKEPQQ
jgi:hypothetical protein